jgi:hypothetical protein
MRHVVIALCLLVAGCIATPKPFEHDADSNATSQPKQDKIEVAIAPPANMPDKMAERVAAALAIELQSYNIVAGVQPTPAPLKVAGAMSTRDAEFGTGIEIEVEWFVLGKSRGIEGPAISKTVVQAQDFAEATDRLVSRIAQQAAPRIATLMGKPPAFEARAPGQVAAGVNCPPPPTAPVQTAAPAGRQGRRAAAAGRSAPASQRQIKVMVAPVEGAPSDGNRQLFGGMRRALGSSKIVVMDSPAADTFTCRQGQADADRRPQGPARGDVVPEGPAGKEVGKVEQSNPVPLAAARGSWAGFGDIVAQAAVEGVLECSKRR